MKIKLLVSVIFIILLSSCNDLPSTGAKVTDTSGFIPKQIVKMAFDALKEADSNTFNQLVEYVEYSDGIVLYKDNKMFGNNLDNESKEYIESVFASLTYEIGDVEENGDTATVQIKIINRDLSNIYEDMLKL